MPFRVRRQDSGGYAGPRGVAGAPKASQLKEVLVTLRDRLQVQVENRDEHEPAMTRALRGNIQEQLEQINKALARIEEGKYGICTNCLKPIAADRLLVRPYSTLCLDCQNRLDGRSWPGGEQL